MKIFLMTLVALMVIVFVFAGPVNLTGTWKGSTDVDGNPIDLSLVLKKEADVYAGSITVAGFSENEEIRDVEFQGDTLKFSFTAYNGSDYLEVKISLSVSQDRMTGYWESEDENYGDIIMKKISVKS